MSAPFHAYVQAAPGDQFEALAQSFAVDVIRPDASAMIRLKTGNHPDFLCIRPDGASIKVGQVRGCLSDLSVRPYEGGRRVVVFFHAEDMTAQAQNCLLKTLEDPPAGTSFLLLCERPSVLLATVRSRCMALPERTELQDNEKTLADTFLTSLAAAQNVLEAAAALPQERTALFAHCTALMDGFCALIHQAAPTRDASLPSLSRCVMSVQRTQSMLEHNVNAALCAQWLCIQIKEECYDNRRRNQV